MHGRVSSPASKVETSITSSFGVNHKTVQPFKQRKNPASDSKFNFDLNRIATYRPNTPPETPGINFKHNLQLAQTNPLREDSQQQTKENSTKNLNLKSFTASSSPITPSNTIGRSIQFSIETSRESKVAGEEENKVYPKNLVSRPLCC